MQYLADFTETFRTVRWLMGSLDVACYAPILAALAPMAVAWAGFATLPRMLDLLSVGSESAAARGVDVERTERIALVSASLATGAAVSLAGPGRVRRHHRAAPRAADRRRGSPARAAGIGAVRRRVSHRLRSGRADPDRAAGTAGRHRHRHHRRPVFLWLLFRRA